VNDSAERLAGLRLCVPIDVKPQGGMYTFVGNLLAWLDAHDLPHTRDLSHDYDVLFVNSWALPYATVYEAKRSHPAARVAHRLDGAAVDYGSSPASDRVQARVNLLADVSIFQSRYSRHSTRDKFKVIARDGPIIYNPVDIGLFRPDGPRIELPDGVPRVACASWSTNRGKGTWRIDRLAEAHPGVCFVLCGRFDAVEPRPNVVRLGHLGRAQMADALRSCDVFLNLSEHDPCPNVVIEALASGLPVLFADSGGVPELVGDCGLPVTAETFAAALQLVLDGRVEIGRRARQRAESRFAPEIIFPQYLEAFASARRGDLPRRREVVALAGRGYPVLPTVKSPADLAGALRRRVPSALRWLSRRESPRFRVGWVTYDSFPGRKRRLQDLDTFTGMRVGNVARWLNAHVPAIAHELYDPDRRYDVVVFQKMMDARCQAEAEQIKASGGKVLFDANVNYYDISGDYFIPGTQPTDLQRHDALRMTALADWVVADSSFLEQRIRPINSRVTWIPDNVNMRVYRGTRAHRCGGLRLVWSGIGRKASHLLLIVEVLAGLRDAELVLVTDEAPSCLAELERAIRCRVVRFGDRRYARTLLDCDVIVSPKRLVNAYEMAHTEYKITLGMAVGLPAVASPQPSYVEAIGYAGGGLIADKEAEWTAALETLVADRDARQSMGDAARRTVHECYDTPVIARRYQQLLHRIAQGEAPRPDERGSFVSPAR
jgi:glycosyltransferase involved in cell wall biosynthesis